MEKLMQIHEVSKLTGLSIRTLQYYDSIGLLLPSEYTQAGYRMYGTKELEKLQQIMLFKELEFSLKDIKRMLKAPDFDREKAITQQIEPLTLKREQLDRLIEFARKIKKSGAYSMDFDAFDTSKIDEYTKKAKEQWGQTTAYKEFEEKSEGWTKEDTKDITKSFMKLFEEFGTIKDSAPSSPKAQAQVKKLQDYITNHFYTCTNEILSSLGQMYASGGEFTENIDKAGGKGTAEFAAAAIDFYTKN